MIDKENVPKTGQKRGFGKFQEKTKDEHKKEIISILEHHGPQRFNQLKNLVKRNAAGLKTTLDDLLEDKLIEYKVDENTGKVFYHLSTKGKREFHDFMTLPFTLSWIEKNNGKSMPDYSGFQFDMWFCYLPWGIRDDLIVSKEIDEKINPITKELVTEIQELLFKRIRSNLKSQNLEQLRSIKGDIVLGFDINFEELIKSIEHKDVLKIRKNTTAPELDIFERMQNGKYTKEDEEKFGIIMEMRKRK